MSTLWMICYDISDDRKRRQTEQRLRRHGERVQWSVFECYLTRWHFEQLHRELLTIIDPQTDTLRCYPLCHWCDGAIEWQGLGRRSDDPEMWIV